jgi:TonB family protein
MNIKLKSYKLFFGILDILSNIKLLHKLVINKKVYFGACIISLSFVNNSCSSDNKVIENKAPDKKDSITKKPVKDSLVENKGLKKGAAIRTINNKHKVLSEPTEYVTNNNTIQVSSCYAPVDINDFTVNGTEVYTIAEEMPKFVGGDDSLKNYIITNLVWPKEAQEVEGSVYVGFIIETTGALTEISIKKGVHYLLNKEALRLVKSMPKWIPGKQKGKAIRIQYVIPIRFKH